MDSTMRPSLERATKPLSVPGNSDTPSPAKSKRKGQSHRHHHSKPSAMIMDQFLEDEAEATLVTVLEQRRKLSGSNINIWKSAVAGEVPPLSRLGNRHPFDDGNDEVGTSFADIALKLRAIKAANKGMETKPSSSIRNMSTRNLMKSLSGDKDLFHNVGSADTKIGESNVAASHTVTDRFISNAMAVDNLFSGTGNVNNDADSLSRTSVSSSFANNNEELLPLRATSSADESTSSKPAGGGAGWFGCWGSGKKTKKDRKKTKRNRLWFLQRNESLVGGILRLLQSSFFAVFGVPAIILALFFFHCMGNPGVSVLPTDASLAWWLTFSAQQMVLLDAAMILEFLLVDGLALRSRWFVKLFGPLVTLSVIQAKGWPFLAVCWAILDLVFRHAGDGLFWTDIKLIADNSGSEVLTSEEYNRILLAVLFTGFVHSVKRTTVAMHFGKNTFINYHAKLEKILSDIVLIAEVAELAAEIDSIQKHDAFRASLEPPRRRLTKWGSMVDFTSNSSASARGVTFESDFERSVMLDDKEARYTKDIDGEINENQNDELTDDGSDDSGYDDSSQDSPDEEDEAPVDENTPVGATSRTNILSSNSSSSANIFGQVAPNSEQECSVPVHDNLEHTKVDAAGSAIPTNVNVEPATVSSASIGSRKLINYLERWAEPVNKLDSKIQDASIGDILKFRKALAYMDEANPFSESFGPAHTRKACIRSSQKLYRRLLKATGAATLNFDLLALVAIDDDGNEMEQKRRTLQTLFRPDKNNELSLLGFVQSCDTVYKRLRFFRASVGNASVIDKVLEGIIDSVFNFILALVVLSMLQFNPWTLLVSISTLLVSLAFAVGPSTARYIEGVLLIALRRPYDLGDRILIVHADTGENQGVTYSWFVEDINLFSTTLRFAATNEVATVNNGAIAMARIVNYARSPFALVTVNVRFMLGKTDDASISVFRAGLERFIKDRPRQWDGMNYFRCETIDTDANMLEYSLRLRHVKTWQNAPEILNDKAEVSRFCMKMGKRLGINFVSPNKRLRLYTSNKGGLNIFNDTQESEAVSMKAMNLAGIDTDDE